MRTRMLISVIAIAIFLFSNTAFALLMEEVTPLTELAQQADLVVVGHVANLEGQRVSDRAEITTRVTLVVNQQVKGLAEPGTSLDLQVAGGRIGDQLELVGGAPTFTMGEQVLVFLRHSSTNTLEVLGMAQGKYHIQRQAHSGELMATNHFDGIWLIDAYGQNGGFSTAKPTTVRAPLSTLTQQIRAMDAMALR